MLTDMTARQAKAIGKLYTVADFDGRSLLRDGRHPGHGDQSGHRPARGRGAAAAGRTQPVPAHGRTPRLLQTLRKYRAAY